MNSPSKSVAELAGNKLLKPNTLNRNIMPPPPPLNKNNSSPKWQANYPGNMSPRYVNSYDSAPPSAGSSSSSHSPSSSSITNKSAKFDNSANQKKQQQQPQQIVKNIAGHRGPINTTVVTGTGISSPSQFSPHSPSIPSKSLY